MKQQMSRAAVDGVELEYQLCGSGEPVVLVHAGIFADFFVPLIQQSILTERFQLVRYHRVGCAGSSHMAGPISIAAEARHCQLLMRHLGIAKAHVVGHSNSGNLVLQLAMDAPECVHTLVISEPALMTVPSARTAREFVRFAMEQYRAGDKVGAIDTFLQGTCGPDYRAVVDPALPGAIGRYAADVDTFFGLQLPALLDWHFGSDEAQLITQPVLAVIGEKSKTARIWNERQDLLLTWFQNAEPFTLARAGHLLQVENPRGMALGLAAFFARHPLVASP